MRHSSGDRGDSCPRKRWPIRLLRRRRRYEDGSEYRGQKSEQSQAAKSELGLHRVTVREIDSTRVKIGPIEAFDGTPVVDIKSASTRAMIAARSAKPCQLTVS
jgi:tRNA (Thr-GGU) A37 N-methylase